MTSIPQRNEELAKAVLDVLGQQQAEARDRRVAQLKHSKKERRQPPLVFALISVWSLLAWVWIARPSIVFVAAHVPALTSDETEAKARYALYLERGRIDTYIAKYGALPKSLGDAGSVENGVNYRRGVHDYILEYNVNGVPLRMTSVMSADSFLGSAVTRLGSITRQ